MKRVLHTLTLMATAVWLIWNVVTWRSDLLQHRAALTLRITRAWPHGKDLQALQDRIAEKQYKEDYAVHTAALLRLGLGLLVLRIIAVAVKPNPES